MRGDMADLAEPLYELMANEVRPSHAVATDDTIMAMLRTRTPSHTVSNCRAPCPG